jgi:hypothetical protein
MLTEFMDDDPTVVVEQKPAPKRHSLTQQRRAANIQDGEEYSDDPNAYAGEGGEGEGEGEGELGYQYYDRPHLLPSDADYDSDSLAGPIRSSDSASDGPTDSVRCAVCLW